MYKQYIDAMTGTIANKAIIRVFDSFCIPFDPANTDYANFKRDIEEGAELQDADGNVMTADAAKEFIRSLP